MITLLSNSCAAVTCWPFCLHLCEVRDVSMEKVRQFGRYFIWCVAAAALVFLSWIAAPLRQRARSAHARPANRSVRLKPRSSTTGMTTSCSPSQARIAPTFRSTACRASMISAVLTAEDRYFFSHAGMDVIGLARAAWVDLKARAVKQGGSTITQQLIRQRGLDDRSQLSSQNQRGAARAARRAPIRQETNPRGVSQSHLPRQRALRCRGRRARLLRQVRIRDQHAPKARCLPASFRARQCVRREPPRTSPGRAATRC